MAEINDIQDVTYALRTIKNSLANNVSNFNSRLEDAESNISDNTTEIEALTSQVEGIDTALEAVEAFVEDENTLKSKNYAVYYAGNKKATITYNNSYNAIEFKFEGTGV